MDETDKPESCKPPEKVNEDAEDVEKTVAVVVKRRKTVPAECLKIMRETAAIEMKILENSKVAIEESVDKENIKEMVQSFKKFNSFKFSCADLLEAKEKFKKLSSKTAEIDSYLKRRNQFL